MSTDTPVVMQPRCVFCGCEHYCVSVPAISNGDVGCGNCGRTAPVFHVRSQYQAALFEALAERHAARQRSRKQEP